MQQEEQKGLGMEQSQPEEQEDQEAGKKKIVEEKDWEKEVVWY